MGKDSAIEWTHHTFNPWWGCEKVSPACTRCYAETFAKRVGQKVWGKDAPRRTLGEKYWRQPIQWNAAAADAGERHRVFCASMADVFEARADLDVLRARLWSLIEATPNLDWLLLTKRPENIAGMLPPAWLRWPRPNVWLGTTVENQEWADKRIPHLLNVPAAVRFLSVEPLLGKVDLLPYFMDLPPHQHHDQIGCDCDPLPVGNIDWVIVGGESGHGARPLHPNWVEQVRDHCAIGEVKFFFKQWGEWAPQAQLQDSVVDEFPGARQDLGEGDGSLYWMKRVGKKAAGRLLDGREWNDIPDLERSES